MVHARGHPEHSSHGSLAPMSVTFRVSEASHSNESITLSPVSALMKGRLKGSLEAAVDLQDGLAATKEHAFIGAAQVAFSRHLPLVLRPDDVWLLIVQGLAQHVQLDPEGLRSRLVKHEGQIDLVVIRDEFVRGSSDNDWAGVFPEFGSQIKSHVGKRHDLIVGEFSTTEELDRVVGNLALMDVMQAFFKYTVLTRCGIPEITLLGTADDWRSVRERAMVLSEFDLCWWTEAMEPALSAFVSAAEGNPDREYWQSFYKREEKSGGPYVSGWINTLFPYVRGPDKKSPPQRNSHALEWDSKGWASGPNSDDFLHGMRSMPFTWNYLGTQLPMRFHGGFMGVRQDQETLAVAPQLGWAVEDLSKR